MEGQTDRAGVIFPPPLVALVALIAAVVLHYFWPLPVVPRSMAVAFGACKGAGHVKGISPIIIWTYPLFLPACCAPEHSTLIDLRKLDR